MLFFAQESIAFQETCTETITSVSTVTLSVFTWGFFFSAWVSEMRDFKVLKINKSVPPPAPNSSQAGSSCYNYLGWCPWQKYGWTKSQFPPSFRVLSRHNLSFFSAVLLGSRRVRSSSSTWAVPSWVVWNANSFAVMPEVPFALGLIEKKCGWLSALSHSPGSWE